MKNLKMHLTAILMAVISGTASAVTVLQDQSIKDSPYYTGSLESTPVSPKSLPSWLDSRSEDKSPKDILEDDFIIDDKRVLSPLYKILTQLLQGWPGKTPEVSIFVVANKAKNIYGAKTLIANEILINYTTLTNVESDDELAAIVAHELAHVLLAHNKETDYFNQAAKLFDSYHSIKLVREVIQASSINKTGDKHYSIEIDESIFGGMMQANHQREQANQFYHAFHGTAFSRGSEKDADLLATDLLIKAGFSPRGLKDSLERLSSAYETETLVHKALKASSAKIMENAQQELLKTLVQYNKQGAIEDPEKIMDGLKKRAFQDITEALFNTTMDFLKRSHPVPYDRMKNLAEYLDENYSRRERNRKKSNDILNRFSNSEGLNILKKYDTAERALAKTLKASIEGTNFAEAEKLRILSISGVTATDPFTRYQAYQVRKQQNQGTKAIANLHRIDSFLAVPNQVLQQVIGDLAASGNFSKATQAIKAKERYLGTVPGFYPAKIQLALNNNNTEHAKQLAMDCVGYEGIDHTIEEECLSFSLIDQKEAGKNRSFFGSLKSTAEEIKLPWN